MPQRPGASAEFTDFITRASASPGVLGLVLSGSQARQGMATARSDHDVYVITADDGAAVPSAVAEGRRSPALDVMPLSLSEFRTHALPGDTYAWDRYAFVHSQVLLDRLDGTITRLVHEKAVLKDHEAHRLVRSGMDAYINSLYRSAKSHRDGRPAVAHLDAAESVPYLLTVVFALHRRVRPYNKYLPWELEHHPLGAPQWAADTLLPRIRRVLADGDLATQHALFATVERAARQAGHASVLDSWGTDIDLLRPAPPQAAPGRRGRGD
ncbi:hypothetical protein GCM10011583_35590 [Streptomyces camponoticapitis]|uniref:Nucleotidyltransferase domain-containing protein n=1 Tax=Streptomyces camponoticapitis TaxID=1616125 RepID=A0ABQ2E9Y2_9ACTN|nr:hypothetical protein [Streptomyces camponoticapitis]GGK01050.1 hypothetical protein GCM10011583_35590 [Streptomyces camponoticapitis]